MEQKCQKLAKAVTGPKYWEDRCKTDNSHRKESKLNTAPSVWHPSQGEAKDSYRR